MRRLQRALLVMVMVPWFLAAAGCRDAGQPRALVVYASQDEVYAEPILREFTHQTGIEVRAVYDSEAVKTVGLANRILAERGAPQADLFWSNEEFRTRQLAAAGAFRVTNGWSAFGGRTRRIVVNTRLVPEGHNPIGLESLTNAVWKGRVALAYPMFGSTSTHFQVLRQRWGDARWQAWCRGLAANSPWLVEGNSVVVQLVGRGQAVVGLTDSDDIEAGQREGLSVRALPWTDEMLWIPNTVGILRGRPDDGLADRLAAHLRSPAVLRRLLEAHAIEAMEIPPEGRQAIQWDRLLEQLPQTTEVLSGLFLR